MSPHSLYLNSFLHYCKDIRKEINDKSYILHIYFLDKRFVKLKDKDYIEAKLQGTKIKDLDEYYYAIYSFYYLNNQNVFYTLLQNSIIFNIEEFENYYRRS